MSQTISAVYENGVLVLDEPLSISEGSKVEITVTLLKKKSPAELLAEIAALPLEGKTDKFSGRDHDKILYGENKNIDENDEWTDEDLKDISLASFNYFEEIEMEDE